MNYLGLFAGLLGLGLFVFACLHLQGCSKRVRVAVLLSSSLLSIPSLLAVVYYAHVLPETAWFYTWRSWPAADFAILAPAVTAAAMASLLPRVGVVFAVSGYFALALVPQLKPLIRPLPDSEFHERWHGAACLQSTFSTCGPAATATMLKHLGTTTSERAIARAAYSYEGGTEAWYLARYVRSLGYKATFHFLPTFTPAVPMPALIGVKFGGAGHFITVLQVHEGQVTYMDPLSGPATLPLAAFEQRYRFTGFHMSVRKA